MNLVPKQTGRCKAVHRTLVHRMSGLPAEPPSASTNI